MSTKAHVIGDCWCGRPHDPQPWPKRTGGIMADSLRQIVEDTLLLAANIREGEHLDETGDTPEAREAERQWRIVELIVSIAERTAETAGLDEEAIWVPDGVADVAFEGVRKPA